MQYHIYIHIHNSKCATDILFCVNYPPWSTQHTVFLASYGDSISYFNFFPYLLCVLLHIMAFNPNAILVFSGYTQLPVVFLLQPLYLLLFSYHYRGKSHSICLMFKCGRISRATCFTLLPIPASISQLVINFEIKDNCYL